MTANHINEITTKDIEERLAQAQRATVQWTGSMPANAESLPQALKKAGIEYKA